MEDILDQTMVVKKEDHVDNSEAYSNPWHMTNVSDFLYYCCAECNYKDKEEETFILHATLNHPKVGFRNLILIYFCCSCTERLRDIFTVICMKCCVI
jgi:hypothetical protein